MDKEGKVTVELPFVRETKNALLYSVEDIRSSDFAVGNIYVKKSAFNGGSFPQKIRVTVEAV